MMPDAVSIGPVMVPPVVIVGIAGVGGASAMLALLRRIAAAPPSAEGTNQSALRALVRSVPETTVARVSDRIVTMVLVGFLVWKITPVFTWSEAVLEDPVRLLRLPGGRPGTIAGSIAAAVVLAVTIYQDRRAVRPLVAALGFGLLGAAIAAGFLSTVVDSPSAASGRYVVEDLTATAPDGATVPLAPANRPTVLTFWATWCGPCHAEIPVKQEAYRRLEDTVNFVAVNMTATESGPAAVMRYVEEEAIDYPVVLDTTGTLTSHFSVRGTPTTIVLNESGEPVARWLGPSSLDRILRAVATVAPKAP